MQSAQSMQGARSSLHLAIITNIFLYSSFLKCPCLNGCAECFGTTHFLSAKAKKQTSLKRRYILFLVSTTLDQDVKVVTFCSTISTLRVDVSFLVKNNASVNSNYEQEGTNIY